MSRSPDMNTAATAAVRAAVAAGAGRRRLPPWVQRLKRSNGDVAYRGWAMINGRRVFGYSRDDALVAHRDAAEMRRVAQLQVGNRRSLRDAADAMHAELETKRAAGTVQFYRQQAAGLFRFVREDLALDDLTPDVVQDVIIRGAMQAGLSVSTLRHYRSWLDRLLTWAARPPRRWFTRANPLELAEWPDRADRPAPDVLDESEISAILAQIAPDPFAAALVTLFSYTGLRRAEVGRLHTRDVDFVGRVIWVRGKTRDESVPIVDQVLAAVQQLVATAAGGYLIPGETDQRRAEWIGRFFARLQESLGEPRLHAHALRHSLATNLVRHGVAPATVQRMLRHSTYTTTQRYVHLVADDLREAAARLRYVKGDGPELLKGAT